MIADRNASDADTDAIRVASRPAQTTPSKFTPTNSRTMARRGAGPARGADTRSGSPKRRGVQLSRKWEPSPTSTTRRSGCRAPGHKGGMPLRMLPRCRPRGRATSGSIPSSRAERPSQHQPQNEQRNCGGPLPWNLVLADKERPDKEHALVAAAHRERRRGQPTEFPRVNSRLPNSVFVHALYGCHIGLNAEIFRFPG